jgi:hypothetical protein
MNLAIAITLAALIALIGVAFKCVRLSSSGKFTQVSVPIDRKGGRMTLFSRTWIAGAIAAAFMAVIGASILAIGHTDVAHLVSLFSTSGILFGAVTFNWLWPATGAAGPTAAQVQNQNSVIVDVTTDGAATTFTVTHNLGISAADIALGFPNINIEPNSASGIPATLLLVITRPIASGNAVIFTCAAVVGTFRVKISGPHSMVR